MDDIIMVDQNPEFLAWVRDEVVDRWAKENGVRRHPRKMYLQHYAKGVLFTGGMVKQGRIYISRRTLGIARQNVVFAIGVKVAVLVLATFGLATMWLAVFADVGVTVLAVLNAMRSLAPHHPRHTHPACDEGTRGGAGSSSAPDK
jgi:hypothetical protein